MLHEDRLLLARNQGLGYWYPPGGGWEAGETLPECGAREIFEETGLRVKVGELLYVQEFYGSARSLELTFLANLASERNEPHIPEREPLTEARWFSREEVQSLTVYPPQLKEVWGRKPKYEGVYIGFATGEPRSGER